MLTRDASVTDLFLELVSIRSPSGRERAVGDEIRAWLSDAGVPAAFDGTGERNDSDAGNLIATVDGDSPGPALLFVAHMDTVESGAEPVRPRLGADGVIRSAGDTILGADNKSAVAAVMRACRAAAQLPAARRPRVVAAFTCREESGRMGASLLDLGALNVDCAFSVDGSQPIGNVITRALGQTTFVLTVRGRAAHAAANPEAGVSAIAVAAEIVAALPLGRRPEGGSLNIAAILGGSVIGRPGGDPLAAIAAAPTNSVPDLVHVRGEARGWTVEEIERTVTLVTETAESVCERRGATYELARDRGRMVPPLAAATGSRALAIVRAAAEAVDGVTVATHDGHATYEANYLAAPGGVVAMASGGAGAHEHGESITVAELQQLEALLIRIIELAGADGGRP